MNDQEKNLNTVKILTIANALILVLGIVFLWSSQTKTLQSTREMHEEAVQLAGGGGANDRFGRLMQELVDQGKMPEVVVACRNEAKIRPNSIYVHYYQGVGNYHLGAFQEAQTFFASAKKVDPTWAPTIDAYIHAMEGKGLSAAQAE